MKIWFLVCITLGLDIKTVLPSSATTLPDYNFTDKESTSTSSSGILLEIPSIMDAYNSKALLTFGQPCSYKAEIEFISDLVTKSDHADFSNSRSDVQENRDSPNTSPPAVHFEREKLLHGMKQLIQNSDGLCDYKKQLTCHKDNKCGYGSTSNAESEAGFALDERCKSGLPVQSSCIISQDAQPHITQMSGSSSVADSADFRDDSSYFSVQDKQDHDHVLIAGAGEQARLMLESPTIEESARGQRVIRGDGNVTASSAHMGLRMYETPAAAVKISHGHKYSEFSDSISTITICMHFFLLITSIVIMMVSFVL